MSNAPNASRHQFIKILGNLGKILQKAVVYADAHKIDHKTLLDARLYPNMFTLTRQVQIATDMVRNGCGRLAGIELLAAADTETSFAELQMRINQAIDYLSKINDKDFDIADNRDISIKVQGNDMQFKGDNYLISWVIPNFYFHITTAYAILRHNGLDIGKGDFLA